MVLPPYNTEDKRRDLLTHYLSTEPDIRVNSQTYNVSVAYHDLQYVLFYAVSKFNQRCAAITKVTRDTWEKIDNGLSMCYLLNTVLESLESGVKKTGGYLDPAYLC